MTLHSIPLKDILLAGPDFDSFIFTFPLEISSLQASIHKVGLLNPVWIRQHKAGLQIVCGCKRALAFKQSGRKEIPAYLITEAECSPEQALMMSLADNGQRELNAIEKARALHKFHHICNWNLTKLAAELAPQLGLPPSIELVQNYLSLLSFEADILTAVASGRLSPAHAFLLSPLSAEERRTLFDAVLQTCAPTLNECREVVDNLVDLKIILNKTIAQILSEPPLSELLSSPMKHAKEKCRLLRAQLQQMRFPSLTQLESQFDEMARGLSLKPNTRVRHTPYFEGNHLEINLRASSETELGEALAQLSAAVASGGFKKLFQLVRGAQ
jgi:ParB/RepB/Spo0J family partition protein